MANPAASDFARLMAEANGRMGASSPPVDETSGTRCGNSQRVVASAGGVADGLLHPTFTVFERVFRKLPPRGSGNASRSSPVVFELGSFQVEASRTLAIGDYEFLPFRLGGVGGSDPVPLEDGRLSSSIGFDLTISQTLGTETSYDLLPTEPQIDGQEGFFGQPQIPSPFPSLQGAPSGLPALAPNLSSPTFAFDPGDAAAAFTPPLAPNDPTIFRRKRSSLNNTPRGAATLPQRRARMGAPDLPFTLYGQSGQTVQLRAVLYEPLVVPIAYFQARISGYYISANALASLLKGTAPCL